jgi:hypothetical protein
MDSYRVVCDKAELPRGAQFTTLPFVNPGDLTLIEVSDTLLIGRWYPDLNGCDYMEMPDVIIEVSMPVRVIGRVIPVEAKAVCLN